MEGFKKGLSGSTLKWIAIVTMLIDHIGIVVLVRMLLYYQYAQDLITSPRSYQMVYCVMEIMRAVGRLAFPIFCFLLVEGFQKTHNEYKYALRMGIFALLTEIPFDLALAGKVVHLGYQNVMVTLLIGILTMWGCSQLEKKFSERKSIVYIGCGVCVGMGLCLAHILRTDYGAKGILCIMVLYFFRTNKLWQSVAGAISLIWEAEAMISFFFIYLYNGQRGKQMKYFFYLFYPVHLLVLYLVCYMLKIYWIPVI